MPDTPNTLQPDAKQRWSAGSALFYAVDHHNLPMAQAMVKAGADLNQLDSHGKTAMQHAVAHGDLAMVGLLGAARREQERGQGLRERSLGRGIERD